MNKFFCSVIIAAFSLTNINAQNHEKLVLKDIGIDSLRVVVKQFSGLDVFYSIDKGDDSLKVSLENYNRDLFLDDLSKALKQINYSMTRLNKSIVILKGVGILSVLPEDYFSNSKESDANIEYLKAIADNDKTASSANKIYRIGDPNSPKKDGRALLIGTVRNLDSGEPIAGASVVIENPFTAVTTDAFGFYRIMIPPGNTNLLLKGYGLEESKLMLEVFGDGEMNIVMKDKVYSLKGVVLTSEGSQKMRSTQMGLEKVRIDRIKHVPSAFGEADVMKIVLTLPGVKSVGEAKEV